MSNPLYLTEVLWDASEAVWVAWYADQDGGNETYREHSARFGIPDMIEGPSRYQEDLDR